MATFRSHVYLTRREAVEGEQLNPYARLLARRKSKLHQRRDIRIHWRDGVFVILEGGGIERRSCEEVFVTLLKAMLSENRWVSPSKHAGNYAPQIFADAW